jgi:hypothetical protein
VVWLFYTSIVMRVVWVPSIADSLLPFLIGLLEFILAELLAPEFLHLWLLLLASMFAISNATSVSIFRRARRDPDNADFFKDITKYTAASNLQPAAFVLSLLLASAGVYAFGSQGVAGLLAMCLVLVLLGTQVVIIHHFWMRTTSSPPEDAPAEER